MFLVRFATRLDPIACSLAPGDRIPLTRRVAPAFDERVCNVESALRQAVLRAREIVDSGVTEALYNGTKYGGLVVLRGALGPVLTNQLRSEAIKLKNQGRLRSDGQERVGRFDITCMLEPSDAILVESPGIAYGVALLGDLCLELNRYRSTAAPVLEPGPAQLACYDGGGAYYTVHRDHSDFGVLPFLGDGLPDDPAQRVVARRRVTAILYLQEGWRERDGGMFRAHSGTVFQVLDQQSRGSDTVGDFVDVSPEGGTIILFRSRDLAHEVLPAAKRRVALSMWCLETV